ncbi:hypothetical protein M1590_00665 [Candidatus Marsarchaeota archaeon]|nr:hypothetical protein [Candidatus Marsarchaeota archaeon]
MHGRHKKPELHVPMDGSVIHNRQDIIVLRESDRLKKGTKVQGQYEKALKDVLLEMGSLMELCWYQPVKLDLGGGDIYPPDFALPYLVNGKQVIVELHNADSNYFERMGRLRQKHGDRLYYILVKSYLPSAEGAHIEIGRTGEHGNCVDECWHMPRIYTPTKNTIDERGYEYWKTVIKAQLEDFILNRADKVNDWESAAVFLNIRRAS